MSENLPIVCGCPACGAPMTWRLDEEAGELECMNCSCSMHIEDIEDDE